MVHQHRLQTKNLVNRWFSIIVFTRSNISSQPSVKLTFQSLPVTWCTNSLTFNNCTFCPHCICVFCIYLRTNSDLCHLQHKLSGFYNRDEKCLLRGTKWVFKQSGLRFVFKGLIFNNCTYCPHCIYVFCIYLRTNSDLCHLYHKMFGFYNRKKCLLRGTDWVFKKSSLRFLFKGLIHSISSQRTYLIPVLI